MENNESTKRKPVAGFDTHPENINRNGRPLKGHSITEIIQDMMTEKPEIKKALGQKILQLALAGDMTAVKTIWAYLDGQPIQKNDITITEPPIPILVGENDVSKHDSLEEDTEPNQTD